MRTNLLIVAAAIEESANTIMEIKIITLFLIIFFFLITEGLGKDRFSS